MKVKNISRKQLSLDLHWGAPRGHKLDDRSESKVCRATLRHGQALELDCEPGDCAELDALIAAGKLALVGAPPAPAPAAPAADAPAEVHPALRPFVSQEPAASDSDSADK